MSSGKTDDNNIAKIQTTFDIYNEKAVDLIESGTNLLPDYNVDKTADLEYNEEQINSTVESAIINGNSIDEIAENLSDRLESVNENSAVRTARTAAISALNAGTLESFYEAQEMGIKIWKKWVATLDDRTRPSHQMIDGETVELDEEFTNGLQYPGDPKGDPSEVYNCRCTLTAYLPDYDNEEEEIERWSRDKETGDREYVTNKYYYDWLKNKQLSNHVSSTPAANLSVKIGAVYSSVITEYTRPVYYNDTVQRMKYEKVSYKKMKRIKGTETEKESINKIAGGDETEGSCLSCAFAYAARRGGWDVLDFRGGDSRTIMAQWSNLINNVTRYKGVKTQRIDNTYCVDAGVTLWKNATVGKEYVLVCGRHASVVKNLGNNTYAYLELQSSISNGWKEFKDVSGTAMRRCLNDRFGCGRGGNLSTTTLLYDLDSLSQSKEFISTMGYINTAKNKQQKGEAGHER